MSKEVIIIIGAGAIGRGYLPWVFPDGKYDLVFVDHNQDLVNTMNSQGGYHSYMSKEYGLEEKFFSVKEALLIEQFDYLKYENINTVYIAVGPRNVPAIAPKVKGISAPIVLLENDDKTVPLLCGLIGQDNVYFAIPDVITSNTASDTNLKKDKLAVHTENGVLFVDERAKAAIGDINYCSTLELNNQWTAKLFLHNTPHCIAAYLGSLRGTMYVHDPMKHEPSRNIVEGVMNEMLKTLKLKWDIPHQFLDWYAAKELSRFSNENLCDPISRVAREPFRKLSLDGRLIGAALMCLEVGFIPYNILLGIVASLLYANKQDPDNHIIFVMENIHPKIILSYLIKLRDGEVLERLLEKNFNILINKLEKIAKDKS